MKKTIIILTLFLFAVAAGAQPYSRVNKAYTFDQVLTQVLWKNSANQYGIGLVQIGDSGATSLPTQAYGIGSVASQVLYQDSRGKNKIGVHLDLAGNLIPDGTAANNTLRWSGTAWVETANTTTTAAGNFATSGTSTVTGTSVLNGSFDFNSSDRLEVGHMDSTFVLGSSVSVNPMTIYSDVSTDGAGVDNITGYLLWLNKSDISGGVVGGGYDGIGGLLIDIADDLGDVDIGNIAFGRAIRVVDARAGLEADEPDEASVVITSSGTHALYVTSGVAQFADTVVMDLVTVTTTPYVADAETFVVVDDDTVGGAAAVTLTGTGATDEGRFYTIKKVGNTANVTLTPATGTIDGNATHVLSAQYESVSVVFDGSNWWIY